MDVVTAIQAGILYSPYYDQLIFAYRNKEGAIACIQARNFNPERAAKAKYFNSGRSSEVSPIFKAKDPVLARHLVITEDALSSLRIAALSDAMPALGTHVPVQKIIALKPFYEFVTVWLDSDKLREAREIAEKCKWLGLSAKTVYSELDPKCYTNEEILEFLK